MSKDEEVKPDELNQNTDGNEALEHSSYKLPETNSPAILHHLTGMYQNWFLDYASYVILERAVPVFIPCAVWRTDVIIRLLI